MNIKEGCNLPMPASWSEVLSEHRAVAEASAASLPALVSAAIAIQECLRGSRKILVCGNGGSHAQAQHFAAELVVRFKMNRDPMAAMALGCNPAVLTAVNNDLNHRDIFVREAKALLLPGDVLFGISTSGISSNVCRALAGARELQAVTIGLTGQAGMGVRVDHEIRVPSLSTARIQEMHMVMLHWLCESINA